MVVAQFAYFNHFPVYMESGFILYGGMILLQLHAISPGHLSTDQFIQQAKDIQQYVHFIHIRERHWQAKDYLFVINTLQQNKFPMNKLIINDRVDIASVTNIQQVQLASHSLEIKQVKTHFPTMYIGRSVHSLQSAISAENAGADHVIFGHIFPTTSKDRVPPRGVKQLEKITDHLTIPVIAIGGITIENMAEVFQAGAKGIAVMSGIFSATNWKQRAKGYYEQLQLLKEELT